MRNFNLLIVLSISILFSQTVFAQLKDPKLRDEDISLTKVTANYKILSTGLFEYYYDIESPKENKGTTLMFKLDISCEYDFGEGAFPQPTIDSFKNHSKNGLHIPVQADGVMHHTVRFYITAENKMKWTGIIEPGDIFKGFRLVSPASPSMISYQLIPDMDVDGWDYNSYDENDPTVPWISDFTITGMILGPACPSADGSPSEDTVRFPGTNKHSKEPPETNNLLSYEAPFLNQFHVDDNVKEIEMIIHYDKSIDPKTFKVKPKKLRKYFDPVAGSTQTLKLPLKKFTKKHKKDHKGKLEDVHIAKIKLEVKARRIHVDKVKKHHKPKHKDHSNAEKSEKLKAFISQVKEKHEKAEDKRRPKDKDVFTIRIDH